MSSDIVLPDSATILFVLPLATKVIITFWISVLLVIVSGTLVSAITLLFSSVNTRLSPDIATLFVVLEVFVIVNSVRWPLSATRTTFSLVSDVKVPFITNVGWFVAAAPLSISIPLFASVPL